MHSIAVKRCKKGVLAKPVTSKVPIQGRAKSVLIKTVRKGISLLLLQNLSIQPILAKTKLVRKSQA